MLFSLNAALPPSLSHLVQVPIPVPEGQCRAREVTSSLSTPSARYPGSWFLGHQHLGKYRATGRKKYPGFLQAASCDHSDNPHQEAVSACGTHPHHHSSAAGRPQDSRQVQHRPARGQAIKVPEPGRRSGGVVAYSCSFEVVCSINRIAVCSKLWWRICSIQDFLPRVCCLFGFHGN